MKGMARIDSVDARATRSILGTMGSVIAAIRLKSMPSSWRLPSTATTTMANTMMGKDSMTSTRRWMALSMRPPK